MRLASGLLLGIVLACGCLPRKEDAPFIPQTAQRIELQASLHPGLPAPLMGHEMVLEKGRCKCKVTHGRDPGPPGGRTVEYDLPAEMFEEARALLREVDFAQMKAAKPDFGFEASTRILAATCDGATRVVSLTGHVAVPPGFEKLWAFATSGPARGKVVERPAP